MYIHHILFIHLSVNEHLSFLSFWVILENIAMNIEILYGIYYGIIRNTKYQDL